MKLNKKYYQQKDVVFLAKDLIGKVIYSNINNQLVAGIIIETEAYKGVSDKACHAYGNNKTPRNEAMFENGGIAYVYLCYGIHYLFNIVTNTKNNPDAVLIRGIFPLEGVETILKRRNQKKLLKNLTFGPGKVTQALAINKAHNKIDLTENKIWIEDKGLKIPTNKIHTSPRIGVDYAGEDALLPYRFFVEWKEMKETINNRL